MISCVCSLFLLASPVWTMTPGEVREKINNRIMQVEAAQPAVLETFDKKVDETPVRFYIPTKKEASLPIIILIHGGAWVAGSIDTHDNLARYLCQHTESVVISVGYYLAPESKFPTQLEQSYNVLLWAITHAQEFSGDPKRFAIVGDSAGGNMAAALCLMARDRGGPKALLQVLINPAIDLSIGLDDFFAWQVEQYLAKGADVKNPYISPGSAANIDNLPPLCMIVAEKDSLRPSAEAFAKRMLGAGNAVELYCQADADHLAGDAARASTHALLSLNAAVQALNAAFYQK